MFHTLFLDLKTTSYHRAYFNRFLLCPIRTTPEGTETEIKKNSKSMKREPARGVIFHVHLRKVHSESACEVSSKNTPKRQAATLPRNHGNAVVR